MLLGLTFVIVGRRGTLRATCLPPALLLLSIWYLRLLSLVSSQEITAQCAQVGQKKGTYWDDAPYTIGGKRFLTRHRWTLGVSYNYPRGSTAESNNPFKHYSTPAWKTATCPAGYAIADALNKPGYRQYVDWCPSDVDIRAYLVKEEGDKVDRYLRGWLHFEISLAPTSTDTMEYIYVQIRDEDFDAIGEFILLGNEKGPKRCKPNQDGLLSPTDYQYLPCSAIPSREPRSSQAIFVARKSQFVDQSMVKDKRGFVTLDSDLGKGIHFMWKLNEYWCNHHKMIRVDATILTTSVSKKLDDLTLSDATYCGSQHEACRVKRKITPFWLQPKWFGASDIMTMDSNELVCTESAIDYASGVVAPDASSWLETSIKMLIADDYVSPDHSEAISSSHISYKSCQVDPLGTTPVQNIVTFGGRCLNQSSKVADMNNLQGCRKEPRDSAYSNFESYKEYLQKITEARLKQCKQHEVEPCRQPNISNPQDFIDIKNFTAKNAHDPTKNVTQKELFFLAPLVESRARQRSTQKWVTRKFHGIVCIFFSMFLMPVSIFFIRYYKETFMDQRNMGCGPWFWFHLLVCFLVPVIFYSSYSAMEDDIDRFGVSESPCGVLHRGLGWLFISVFLLMTLVGGFRPLGILPRYVTMVGHAVTGFVLYFIAIILVINSSSIPASPSVDQCDSESQLPMGNSFTASMAFTWIGVDIFFHLVLTLIQYKIDKAFEVERAGFYLPIIPILPGDTEFRKNLAGYRFRKMVLLVYVCISLFITISAMVELYDKHFEDFQNNCTLWHMSCNLSVTLPNQSSSPIGCSHSDLVYYKKAYEDFELELLH